MRPSRPRARRRSRPNAIANLMQILSRNCGQTWGRVKRDIYSHPKHADRSTRSIVRDRLETLVCLPNRTPRDFHAFRVNDGILERL